MPSIQVTTEELVEAIKQLPPEELDRVVSQVLSWRDEMKQAHGSNGTDSMTVDEDLLLEKIRAGIPEGTQQRYRRLISKRDKHTLTDEEYAELLKLTDVIENADAERVAYLIQLARIRSMSLPALINNLNINPSNV